MANSSPVVIASNQSAIPVTDNSGSLTIDAVSLPLPTGAATSDRQDTGNASLASIDAKLTNPLPVSASSLPLPSGAATSANQTTIIGHVDGIEGLLTTIDTDTGNIATSTASIDSKTPALGQALAASSVPVVLTAAQLSTLTPPAAITGFATEATLSSVKTAVEVLDNAISGSEMQVDVVAALPTGTNTIGNVGVIQGGNVASVDTAGIDNESNTSTRLNTRTMVSWFDGTTWDRARGDATDGLLVNLGSNNDVTVASLPLPSGAATLAEQQSQTTHLATIAGDTTAIETAVQIMDDWDESDRAKVNIIVGQTGIAAGTGVDGATVPRVTLATNVGLPAGTNNIGDVDILSIAAGDNNIGNVDIVSSALPTGASTSANQTTIIGHLDGVEGLLTTIDTDTSDIAVDADAIRIATQLLDDTVQVLGADTFTEASSKGITLGAVRRDADTTLVNATNEFTPLQVDANGRLKVEAFSGETLPVSLTSTTVTGTVAVTQSGTWDEVGINDSGNSITVDNTVLSVVGGGTEATAQRVTIANDSTGVLSIDDNGGSLTVDGTITANLSATDNAVLDTIDAVLDTIKTDTAALVVDAAAIEVLLTGIDADTDAIKTAVQLIDNAISGSEMQVDIVAALPTGTNSIGTVVNETVSTATLANVAASATSVTVLASAAGRKAAYFFNDSSSFCYLKFGATASTTSFTVKVDPFGFYEIPQPVYTGIIDGIWDSATGSIRVTSM